MRQRRARVEEAGDVGTAATAGKAPARQIRPAGDPVQWFGGAKPPPMELKKAQGLFQEALVEGIELANLQIKFHCAHDCYAALLKEKDKRRAT